MAETHFELNMDESVKNKLTWRTWGQFRNPNGDWETNQDNMKDNLDYRVGFKVTNEGTETYVKNVEIRVKNAYPDRVAFFSDHSYSHQVPRSDQNFPHVLEPGQTTPWHWVYFRLTADTDEHRRITHVGIYAEIIPQGHYWSGFYAPLDHFHVFRDGMVGINGR